MIETLHGAWQRAESRTEESTVGMAGGLPPRGPSESVFALISLQELQSRDGWDCHASITSQSIDLIGVEFQANKGSGDPAAHVEVESVDIQASRRASAEVHGERAVS
jgi:hypothetical protein